MRVNLPRRGLTTLVIGLGVTLAASLAAGPVRAADPSDITAPIVALDSALVAAMKAGHGQPFRERYRELAPTIEGAFDLPTILRVSVGPRWSGLAPAVQAQLLHAFRRFTIASYVANFSSYDGETFEVLPETRSVGADRVVQTRIVADNGRPIRLDYVMRREDGAGGGWRAVDVLMDGTISRVAVQRSDFRSLLASGDATELIASLQHKVADLSGGALDS